MVKGMRSLSRPVSVFANERFERMLIGRGERDGFEGLQEVRFLIVSRMDMGSFLKLIRFLIQRLQARICVWNSLSFIITQIKLKDKRNYLHCFIGRCHWFISEYDGEDLFFGYAILGDSRFGEWATSLLKS